MDETPRRHRANHRTPQGRTPTRAQSPQRHAGQCHQCPAQCRRHELPEAPRILFVSFTPLPAFVVRPGTPGSVFGGDVVKCLFQNRLISKAFIMLCSGSGRELIGNWISQFTLRTGARALASLRAALRWPLAFGWIPSTKSLSASHPVVSA